MAALKGKQKTRPAALNKSGRLVAPGFLANAAASVAMALTVFIASSTPRCTNPQVKETSMAEPLSPAARAVLDSMYEVNMDFNDENHAIAAAALRAAADQVVPWQPEPTEESLGPTIDCGYAWALFSKANDVRQELLAIAAELEGGNG